MGLFNNLIKAVEDGTLEKRLANVADRVESLSSTVTTKAEQAVKAGERSGKSIDTTAAQLQKEGGASGPEIQGAAR